VLDHPFKNVSYLLLVVKTPLAHLVRLLSAHPAFLLSDGWTVSEKTYKTLELASNFDVVGVIWTRKLGHISVIPL
jgi:hypothetical protein